MEKYDLVIIGGGPIGSTLAREVAVKGKRVLVIERKKNIGYPNHCSGMVSDEFLETFPLPGNLILNHIKGANVFSFDNKSITFRKKEDFAVVIDRIGFDGFLYEEASSKGAEYILGGVVTSYDRVENGFIIHAKGEEDFEIHTHLVAIATGASSSIKRMFDFSDQGFSIQTIQTEETFNLDDPEMVNIYMNNEIAHNWFAWVIPVNKNRARIGFGTDIKGNLIEDFHKLKSSWKILNITELKLENPVLWHIPIGYIRETVKDNCILVGDSARQIKPFSGGGLYTGLLSAKFASEVIVESIEKKDYSKEFLLKYEKKWKETVGKEIKAELIIRDVYVNLSDSEKSKIIERFPQDTLNEITKKFGLIDTPWKAGFRILYNLKGMLFKYFVRKLSMLFRVSRKP